MTTSGNVAASQDDCDGGERLHPYLIAFVRWCVSCLWSSATLLLHRLMTAPLPALPAITASKPAKSPKARPAGTEHLHPEPLVECVVLHQPETTPDMDIIFVHGLYGSLGNTWRQGDWRPKYKTAPNRVSLRRSSSIPTACDCSEYKPNGQTDEQKIRLANQCNLRTNEIYNEVKCNSGLNNENKCEYNNNKCNLEINKDNNSCDENKYSLEINGDNYNENKCIINESCYDDNEINEVTFESIDEKFYNYKRILPEDNVFITENFYESTIINQVEIIDNYEIQANFVRDLFELENKFQSENESCENLNEGHNDNQRNGDNEVNCTCKENMKDKCEMGCGCVCDECYSPCWPRDWLRIDYPNARILSVNYTSDPHLWRPLWIKGSKRLHLHERAQQMIEQLLTLGVGQRPIIWVGHSKGGLFIKQIYCEAYEAYLKTKDAKIDDKTDFKCEEIAAEDKDDRCENERAAIDNIDLIEKPNNTEYTHENLRENICPALNDELGKTMTNNDNNTKSKHLNKPTQEDKIEERAYPISEEKNLKNITEIYPITLEDSISHISDNNLENSTNIDTVLHQNIDKDLQNMTSDIKQQQHIDKKLEVINNHIKSRQDIDKDSEEITELYKNFNKVTEDVNFDIKQKKYTGKGIEDTNYIKIPSQDIDDCSEDTSFVTKLQQGIDKILEATNFTTKPQQDTDNILEATNFATNLRRDTGEVLEVTSCFTNQSQDIDKYSVNVNFTTKLCQDTDKLLEDDKLATETDDITKDIEDRDGRVCDMWSNSAGFMFYSVPHRGAALADIITPLTARSTELVEMGKDCSQVLSLHERWLRATTPSKPTVRSLVETCRTLMSVLWLRIVSVDSADAGIGALCGVSVDHREICKPTSRQCLLYTELLNLINAAINKCTCKSE